MSLIEATSTQVGEVSLSTSMNGIAIIWVAKSGSLKDALWFWNIRALMPRSFATHTAALIAPDAATAINVGDAIQAELRSSRKWTTPDVLLISLSEPMDSLVEIGRRWGLQQTEGDKLTGHLMAPTREPDDELTFTVNADPRPWLLGRRTAGLRRTEQIVVSKPRTEVTVRSPVDFRLSSGVVRTRVSGPPFLTVPARPQVAALIQQNALWANGSLELEVPATNTYHLRLGVPEPSLVLLKCLASVGLTHELSQPGKLAAAVRSLASTTILGSRDAQAVVRALTTPRSRDLANEIVAMATGVGPEAAAVLADRLGTQVRRRELSTHGIASRAQLRKPEAARGAELLTQSGFAERGLRVECQACGLDTFVPFRSVHAEPTCPACFVAGKFSCGPAEELAVHYRLNALIDRASDQGAIPHLITADRLDMDPQASFLVLGAHLFEGGTPIGEVDLLGYRGRDLVCGEVKTSATGFTPEEIARATWLAERVQADVLVFGCTDTIPDDLQSALFAAVPTGTRQIEVVDDTGRHHSPQPEPHIGTLGKA